MSRSRIVLFRSSRAEPDPYVAAFAEVGFEAVCQPVLSFEPEGAAEVAERLARPEDYAGLILTSPRAILVLEPLQHLLGGWASKLVYVVGPVTAEAVRALGLQPVGEESGRGAELARRIVRRPPSKPLLFLAARDRRPEVPAALQEAAIPYEEITVYTSSADRVQLREPLPGWVAFFSPSAVRAAEETPSFPWRRLRHAAIGPTTAEALRQAGYPAAAVAAAPTPAALVEAVIEANASPSRA